MLCNFWIFFSGIVKRKTLVLDLDETLIHSFHDGVLRPTVKPGTPPDFILKVTIDRHPVRFFVHKRPHVDYFLQIVSIFISKIPVLLGFVISSFQTCSAYFETFHFRKYAFVQKYAVFKWLNDKKKITLATVCRNYTVMFFQKFREINISTNYCIMEKYAQHYGNYGYSLWHFFGKNFVKPTVLLKKWFDEIFFSESKFFILLPHCAAATILAQNFRQISNFYFLKNSTLN